MDVLAVCILYFYRGTFLCDCVEAIRHCIPDAGMVIFDNNNDDPETGQYLEQAAECFRIVAPGEVGFIKYGGLYNT